MAERQDEPHVVTVADILRHNRDQARYTAVARAVAAASGMLVDADDLTGQPAQAVADSGSGALMLVVGSRGAGGFTAMVLGSVSRYAASHASCPVVVVPAEPPAPQHLVGVGLGEPDDCAFAGWREKYPDVVVHADVVHGHPARALAGLAVRADLVVIGRHYKHSALPGLGVVRHAVLNHAHGSVAIVPSRT
jgi:nucleotide-binding universal stress UspA family protein